MNRRALNRGVVIQPDDMVVSVSPVSMIVVVARPDAARDVDAPSNEGDRRRLRGCALARTSTTLRRTATGSGQRPSVEGSASRWRDYHCHGTWRSNFRPPNLEPG